MWLLWGPKLSNYRWSLGADWEYCRWDTTRQSDTSGWATWRFGRWWCVREHRSTASCSDSGCQTRTRLCSLRADTGLLASGLGRRCTCSLVLCGEARRSSPSCSLLSSGWLLRSRLELLLTLCFSLWSFSTIRCWFLLLLMVILLLLRLSLLDQALHLNHLKMTGQC